MAHQLFYLTIRITPGLKADKNALVAPIQQLREQINSSLINAKYCQIESVYHISEELIFFARIPENKRHVIFPYNVAREIAQIYQTFLDSAETQLTPKHYRFNPDLTLIGLNGISIENQPELHSFSLINGQWVPRTPILPTDTCAPAKLHAIVAKHLTNLLIELDNQNMSMHAGLSGLAANGVLGFIGYYISQYFAAKSAHEKAAVILKLNQTDNTES